VSLRKRKQSMGGSSQALTEGTVEPYLHEHPVAAQSEHSKRRVDQSAGRLGGSRFKPRLESEQDKRTKRERTDRPIVKVSIHK